MRNKTRAHWHGVVKSAALLQNGDADISRCPTIQEPVGVKLHTRFCIHYLFTLAFKFIFSLHVEKQN